MRKYDTAGTLLWSKQLSGTGYVHSASTDAAGNVYVTGLIDSKAFVTKLDANGALAWNTPIGAASGNGVSADGSGSVYVTGYTRVSLAGPAAGDDDVFVAKLSDTGGIQWLRQFGTTAGEVGEAIAADPLGNVFVTGATGGSLAGTFRGVFDAFVRKYDAAGNVVWTSQFGTGSHDEMLGASTDGHGNVFVAGFTGGSLASQNLGVNDVIVR